MPFARIWMSYFLIPVLLKLIYFRLGFVSSTPLENHATISHKVYAGPVLSNEIASGNDLSSYSLSNTPRFVRSFVL